MCDALAHRGPDDQGFYTDAAAAIGMRRLSIIDLATGHQPVRNEDGTVWVVFNGEIYNFKELRRDLLSRGHRFYTTTDTETIVHLYEEYGADAVTHLRGMFAFAVWDMPRRRLLLARDRLGIKPLFYATFEGGLAFASEVKSMLLVPGIGRRLSWGALGHLLALRTTPNAESIVEGVRKLPPAHLATLSSTGQLDTHRYWRLQFEPDRRSAESELVERLNGVLEESVALHLRSDVPVGVFLSGGLDSSAIVATMARVSDAPIETFSIGFAEDEFDELPHARAVARTFATNHHELVLHPDDVPFVEDLVWHLDEPFGDASAIPTFLVSKLAAEHVKVVLSGDGGDEIFAGYERYAVEERERKYDRVPAAARALLGAVGGLMPEGAMGRNFLRHLALDGPRRYVDASTLFRRDELARLLRPDVFAAVSQHDPWNASLACLGDGPDSWLSSVQNWDIHSYLPLDILTKVDRMTMAHSLEARPALLDHRVVEFAATVPPELLFKGRTQKYLLKRAMQGVLPPDIIDRRKHGFSVPLNRWFRGDWSAFVRDLLLSDTSRARGIFNLAYVEKLLRLHDGGRDLNAQLWTLISFELWCRMFLDAETRRVADIPRPPQRRQAIGSLTTSPR